MFIKLKENSEFFFLKLKTWYTDLNVQELRHRNYNGSVDKMSSIDKNGLNWFIPVGK